MKMNKIRIAKTILDDKEYLIILTVDPNGKKVNMTMTELNNDGITCVIVKDDGFIVSKDEIGYEDYEEEYKEMWGK